MTNWKKIGWMAGIGTASLAGAFYALRGVFNKAYDLKELKKLTDQLVVVPGAKVHKLDFSGLTIRIDALLKNPTARGFKMKYPFIRVDLNNSPIGTSQASGELLSIPPNGEHQLKAVMLTFPIIGMASLVGALVKSLQTGKAVKLQVTTTTSIDPLWQVENGKWKSLKDYGVKALRVIPYSNTKPITLKKAAV